MSLLKWSTPERQRAGQILRPIPNEIHLHIFEFIAPPTGRLTPEELGIFINLSRVCRFFANVCLPRIFEFLQFSGSIFRDDVTCKLSRESVLCTQIAAKQPLALSLAKRVRVCHFTSWSRRLDDTGLWAARLFAKKYIDGMSHMKNIRELRFLSSFVDAEHWRAIAALESLEELAFDRCDFLRGPADVAPEKKVKVKVPHLRVCKCTGYHQPIGAIDAQCLRTLAVDFLFFEQVDWLPQSALTELHLYFAEPLQLKDVHAVLVQAPQSLEALCLSFGIAKDVFWGMFDDPSWKNLPLLRSFTLQILLSVVDAVILGIDLLTDLQTFVLKDYFFPPAFPPTEVRRVLRDKLGPASGLRYIDIFGNGFRLVDGEWLEASGSTA